MLLQRFVGLVLLELSELSSCTFSQSGIFFFTCNAGDDASYIRFREKQRTNISNNRSGMAAKGGTEICVLI